MKRDMDLIRKIMVAVEAAENSEKGIKPEIEGYTEEQIAYQSGLLNDANLITAIDVSDTAGKAFRITGLTWEGHDFVEAARNETVWKKAIKIVKEKGGGVTLDIMNQLLTKLLTDQILN